MCIEKVEVAVVIGSGPEIEQASSLLKASDNVWEKLVIEVPGLGWSRIILHLWTRMEGVLSVYRAHCLHH